MTTFFPCVLLERLTSHLYIQERKGWGFNSSLYKKYYACVLTYYFWWYKISCEICYSIIVSIEKNNSLKRKRNQCCFLIILYTNLKVKYAVYTLWNCFDGANATLHLWTNIHWSFGTVLTGFPKRHLDRTFKFSSPLASSLINHIQLLKRWEKEE